MATIKAAYLSTADGPYEVGKVSPFFIQIEKLKKLLLVVTQPAEGRARTELKSEYKSHVVSKSRIHEGPIGT